MNELDVVVLTKEVPDIGLEVGDVGTIVHCYTDGAAYEVEFVTAEGETVALLTLAPADVRPIASHEILHGRDLSKVA